jgi:hypothetical protein
MLNDSVNIEKHIKTYLLICNTMKISVTIAHKMNRSHRTEQFNCWSPLSIVVETPVYPKIPHIHGNLWRIFVDMRMSFSELLPSKQWLEHLIHAPLYKRYNTEIDPTFLNVVNVSENTNELDEIKQRFPH